MSYLSERVYSKLECPHSVSSLFETLGTLGIEIDWVIEAGCHTGSDTKKMIEDFGIRRIYGFEPDKIARIAAERLLEDYLDKKVTISPFALMNKNAIFGVSYVGEPGNGSTQVRDLSVSSSKASVEAIRLDDFKINETTLGCMWLDVEGAASDVILGGIETLKSLAVIKIEVEYHDMSSSRKANFREVIKILKRQGFCVWKCDVNPGYFGDILFIRKSLIPIKGRLISNLNRMILISLHSNVYPSLRKPPNWELGAI
jgi:FkbM family methyltransferase